MADCTSKKNKKLSICKDRPKPLINYYGGKQRVADRILKKMPKHNNFIEPFVGGGAVYWANTESKKFVINDLNKDIHKLYKTSKNSPQRVKSCNLNDMNRNKFNRLKNKPNKSACEVMQMFKHSFGGNGTSYADKGGKTMNNLMKDSHSKKLKNTKVFNEDFKKIAKRYDKKGVVQYWDPPYVKGSDGYQTKGVTPKEVCDCAKELKNAKLIISYDNNPKVRKACKGLKFGSISFDYSASEKNNGKHKELLITNY